MKWQLCPVTPGRVHLGIFPRCQLNVVKGVIQMRPVIQSERLEMCYLVFAFCRVSSPAHSGPALGSITRV